MATEAKQAACLVCGKPCQASDRNQDGTYAHAGCLRQVQVRPSLRSSED